MRSETTLSIAVGLVWASRVTGLKRNQPSIFRRGRGFATGGADPEREIADGMRLARRAAAAWSASGWVRIYLGNQPTRLSASSDPCGPARGKNHPELHCIVAKPEVDLCLHQEWG
jgi:hypothetical protein